MNAYELADELKRCIDDGSTDLVCVCSAVNMLRQQADYIKHLEEGLESSLNLNKAQTDRTVELEKENMKLKREVKNLMDGRC
jgi:cell division protein FtsB